MSRRWGERLCFCPGHNWSLEKTDPLYIPVPFILVDKIYECPYRQLNVGDGRFLCNHENFDSGKIPAEEGLTLYNPLIPFTLRTDGSTLPYNYPAFCDIAYACLGIERTDEVEGQEGRNLIE